MKGEILPPKLGKDSQTFQNKGNPLRTTEKGYLRSLQGIQTLKDTIQINRQLFQDNKLSDEEIERSLQPQMSLLREFEERRDWYEMAFDGKLPKEAEIKDMGILLVSMRLSRGVTQAELAKRMNIQENTIKLEEKNNYFGITPHHAEHIANVLNYNIFVEVKEKDAERSETPRP